MAPHFADEDQTRLYCVIALHSAEKRHSHAHFRLVEARSIADVVFMTLFVMVLLAGSLQASGAAAAPLPNPATAADAGPDEANSGRRAATTNALSDYKAYLQSFPAGRDAKRFEAIIAAREAKLASLNAHPTKRARRAAYSVSLAQALSGVDLARIHEIAPAGGAVRAEWFIAEDGQIEDCHVVQSSGSVLLDQATCQIITKYVIGIPARNAQGLPTRANDLRTINWPS